MTETGTDRGHRRSAWMPALLLVALSFGVTLGVILSGTMKGRGAADQLNFHEPMVRTFIAEGMPPDFSNYLSATTPLYHLALAGVGAVVSDSTVTLRAAGWFFTGGLLGLLVWACTRRTSTPHAIACALPLAASVYVFSSGAWLLPDNTAWLGVLGVLLIALRPRFDAWTIIGGGLALFALVCTRQIHLWAAAPLWTAAWLGTQGSRQSETFFTETPRRIPLAAVMVAATLPAFGAVAYFVWLWGGLVVPRFQGWYTGSSPATAAFQLALFGTFGVFFAGYWLPGLARVWREGRGVVIAGVALATVVSIVPETSYDMGAGRWSGLWNIVNKTPVVAERSPLILGLAGLGSLVLVGLLWSVSFRERWVILAALVGFCAAQTASPQLWQRYNEPFVLLILALLASRTGDRGLPARWLGPAALGLALSVNTYREIDRSTEQQRTYDPSTILTPPDRLSE